MGVLTIIPHIEGHDVMAETARNSLKKQGFSDPTQLQAAGHTVFVSPQMVGGTLLLAKGEGGDFAAAGGTISYKGQYGVAGLERLLADAEAGVPEDEHFAGCFVLLLCTGGKLTLFTDRLGLYKFYRSADGQIWSSSFLACCAALKAPKLNRQGVYEYVFQGTTYGSETLVQGIDLVGPEDRLTLGAGGTVSREARPFPFDLSVDDSPMEVHVRRVAERLGALYADLHRTFGSDVDTALSGGYDSRLTLALLRQQGAVPEVHVYGGDDDLDVLVAKQIAKGEGFTLIHDNKERLGDDSPEGVARAVEAQFWAFDGCPTDGIVGSGSDLATRRARAETRSLALNGGGGEVFRNFFYLPNHGFSVRDVQWTFYSQYDPAMATPLFAEAEYTRRLGEKIQEIFPHRHERLSRTDVEFVYPGFRGRFWTGRNTSLNNRLGAALTPFFEVSVVADALRIPLAHKNHGIFEAALIRHIDPRLAAYNSAYGYNFASPPPLSARLKDWATYLRPPRLRKMIYRMKNRPHTSVMNGSLSKDCRSLYLPEGTPVMDRYFHVGRVANREQLNRIFTLEYLARITGLAAE